MKYNISFLGTLCKISWNICIDKTYFLYKTPYETHKINYLDVRAIRNDKGIIWDTVIVVTYNFTLALKGLSAKNAKSLCNELESSTKKAIAYYVLNHEKLLIEIENQNKKLLKIDKYISQLDIRHSISQISNISEILSHPFFRLELLPEKAQSNLKLFQEITKPNSKYLTKINEEFVNQSIQKFSYLFKKLELHPLSEEQMRAAIINEDRNLLIAAAGSGKTSTIIAKGIYLICSGLAKPDEILILAYNRDAQIDLENRFIKLLGIVPMYNTPIKVKTFHSFGYEIIFKHTNKNPKISEFATGGKKSQSRLFTNLVKNLYVRDDSFRTAWREFLLVGKYPLPDLFNIKSIREYEQLLQEMGAIRRNLPEGMELLVPTIDGKQVRSFEEARIANWLVLNGVEYEYERKYINPSRPNEKHNYNPDFYYPKADLYHEHFAINADGKTPSFIGDEYLKSIDWKRQIHLKNDTKLIETQSAYFFDGTIFDRLEKELKVNNVQFNLLKNSEIDNLIDKFFDPEIDLLLFISFIRHFKANNICLAHIGMKAFDMPDKERTSLFLRIFEAIYDEYSKYLKNSNEIDFEDQINMACDLLEKNYHLHQYKYLLIDEFQDVSQDRKRMIQALLYQNENMKLFAVGDDWQSIYQFVGSDIDIMTHFSDHFGVTSQNYLTQTYRSFQGIVDVASTFIQRNETQLQKTVTATKDINKEQVIIVSYHDDIDQTRQLNDLLNKLNTLQSKEILSVFLLARYGHLKPKYLERYRYLDIKFSTIHASKGLQADYVIILNVETGAYGFPSTIIDDPLMNLIMPKYETYPHAEERRLMYVAITRAKKGVFIFSNQNKISPFITELADIVGVNASSMLIQGTNPCPKCVTGELAEKISKFGKFYGCSNYPICVFTRPIKCPECHFGKLLQRKSKYGPFLSCSRFPYCSYKESLSRKKIKY